MKKLLAITLAALAALSTLIPARARATDFWVNSNRVNASNQNSGLTTSLPKKSIGAMKTLARPGDTLFVVGPGSYTYSDFDSSGSNPTNGGYVAVIGVPSASGQLPSITSDLSMSNPYTYLYGLAIGGDLKLNEAADRCRVVACDVQGSLYLSGADYSTVYGCTIRGPYFRVAFDGGTVKRDSVSGNSFTGVGYVAANGTNYPIIFGDNGHPYSADSVVVYNNTFTELAYTPCVGTCGGNNESWTELFFRTTKLRWIANHTTATVQSGGAWARRFRDDSHDYTFKRDTVIATGPGAAQFMASSYGSGVGPVYNVVIDSCYYNFFGTHDGGAAGQMGLWFYFGMYGANITYTTVLARGHALIVPTAASNNVLNHDTFVSTSGGGALRFGDDRGSLPTFGDSAITLRNCIVKTLDPFVIPQVPITGYDSNGIHSADVRCGAYYDGTAIDSAGVGRYQRRVFADHNLQTYWGYTATAGDNSNMVWRSGDVKYGAPGNNTAVENACGIDSASTYGTALFADSTIASFDPHLRVGSAAIGNGTSSSDIGAVAYVPQPRAVATPSAIYFRSGVRQDVWLYVTNAGAVDSLALSLVCAPTVDPIDAPIYVGYHKPTEIYTNHVAWNDVFAEGVSDPEAGLAVATGSGAGAVPSAKIFYDGTPGFSVRYFSILTNDPNIPVSTPTGCAAGRWLNIPIVIQ